MLGLISKKKLKKILKDSEVEYSVHCKPLSATQEQWDNYRYGARSCICFIAAKAGITCYKITTELKKG